MGFSFAPVIQTVLRRCVFVSPSGGYSTILRKGPLFELSVSVIV